jgi:hypothetical protein
MGVTRWGEHASAEEFFSLLYQDAHFCEQLGRAVLAAGRLEAELKLYLAEQGVSSDTKRATLGRLLDLLRQAGLFKDMQPALEMLKDQRNYLTHTLFELFAGMVEETLLPRSKLIDSDVDMFAEKAWQLERNLTGLAEIVSSERHAKR